MYGISISGGFNNKAIGELSSTGGGAGNFAFATESYIAGGYNSVTAGNLSTAIGGGPTGIDANNAVAIGPESVVTVENGLALGYQATTSEEGTISFGYKKGEFAGYEVEYGKNSYRTTSVENYKEKRYDDEYYNRLVNIAKGKDAYDAVNMSQLTQYEAGENVKIIDKGINELGQTIKEIYVTGLGDLNNKVGELDTRINKVGAGSTALAGLHPLDYDSEEKLDFAASVGNYRNATATAVGLFYRPNDHTMFNLGVTLGDTRNMINGGFSVKLGKGSKYEGMGKVSMAQIIDNQAKKIDEQSKEIQGLKQQIEQIMKKLICKKRGFGLGQIPFL